MNKIRFAMERYRDKIGGEKKQIQLNHIMLKKERNKQNKRIIKKRFEEDIKHGETNKKNQLLKENEGKQIVE